MHRTTGKSVLLSRLRRLRNETLQFNPSGLQWVAAAKMLQFGAPRACSGRAKGGDDSTVIVTGRRVGDDGGSGKIASHSSLPSCRSCCVLSFTRWMDKCGYFLYVDSSFGRGMGDYPPRVSLRYLLSHSAGMASFFFPHLPWSVHSPLSPLCALCSLWRCSCTFLLIQIQIQIQIQHLTSNASSASSGFC